MRDFSLDTYRELLESLQQQGYELIRFSDYITKRTKLSADKKFVILRHDVDRKPENSLQTAQIEHALGARSTYYFRAAKESNKPEIIRAIAQLGHEIGYHYEDLARCNGNTTRAYEDFQTWLSYFRQFYAVETICAHGSPTSKWDNKDLWKQCRYKDSGIIGEPYMDTDFTDVFYLTDTGRCWDGYSISVRDKISQLQHQWAATGLRFHTTPQLLQAIQANQLPAHIMITTHPQRWTNDRCDWWKERVGQSIKNIAKWALVKIKK